MMPSPDVLDSRRVWYVAYIEPDCAALSRLRIPAKLNADSEHREHGFRASRSLIGAKRREQLRS